MSDNTTQFPQPDKKPRVDIYSVLDKLREDTEFNICDFDDPTKISFVSASEYARGVRGAVRLNQSVSAICEEIAENLLAELQHITILCPELTITELDQTLTLLDAKYTSIMKQAGIQEYDAFLEDILLKKAGKLLELFKSDRSVWDSTLIRFQHSEHQSLSRSVLRKLVEKGVSTNQLSRSITRGLVHSKTLN